MIRSHTTSHCRIVPVAPRTDATIESRRAGDNPFSASWIDPRQTEPVGLEPRQLTRWLESLQQTRRPMQLVGPHGSGKTAALAALGRMLGQRTTMWQSQWLCADRMPFGCAVGAIAAAQRPTVWLIDGLDRWSRWKQRACGGLIQLKRHRAIATSHTIGPWSTLAVLEPSLAQLRELVAARVQQSPSHLRPPEGLLEQLYRYHGGNYRDVLFDLYDWWEARHGRHPDPRTLPQSLRKWGA